MSNEKKLIEDICKIESSHGEVYEHIRTKVMKEGKALRELQKLQKEQQKQAKERGEEPQTWKDYLAEKKRAIGLFTRGNDASLLHANLAVSSIIREGNERKGSL